MNSTPARKCRLCEQTPGYPLYDGKCIPCWPKDLKPTSKARSGKAATPKKKKRA